MLADIPGLIEGAHRGVGLGHQFLRHVERARVLLHVVDATVSDPLATYEAVREELELYNPALAAKPELVALNKIDRPDVRERLPLLWSASGRTSRSFEGDRRLGADDPGPEELTGHAGRDAGGARRAISQRPPRR